MPTVGTTPEASEFAYLDFELEIASGESREYPVKVLRSPAGEAHSVLHFPYDELALDSRLKDLQIALLMTAEARRRLPALEEQPVQRFGQDLFEALLSGDVRSAYDISWRQAEAQGKGLRVKLRVQAPALASLPWEFLYDPREGEYLCLMRDRPVVRYIEAVQPVQPLQVTPPLRILGMVVSPVGLTSLDVRQEKQRLAEATQKLQAQGLMEVTWLAGQTWRDLQRAMRGGPWHIFHFVGHGGFDPVRDEGLIVVADDAGQPQYLTATDLSRLLADHRPLRLVLLNACEGARGGSQDIFSSTASILVRRGIPAVVAMQYPITDRAAVEFARSFYESLADGLPADAAVAEARKAMSIAVTDSVEWGTPVLFMRAPDGVLFDLAVQQFAAPPTDVTDMAESVPQQPAHAEEQEIPQAPPTQAKPSRPGGKAGMTAKSSSPKAEPAATTEPASQKAKPAVMTPKRSDAESRKTAGPAPDVARVPAPQHSVSRLNLNLSVQPVSVEEGGAVTWTITVANSGDDDLRAVEAKIGAFSLGTFALAAGEARQMTGSAALEGGANPTVLCFTAVGLNALGQEVRAAAQRAVEVRPRPKSQPAPPASPISTAPPPDEVAALLQKFKRNGLYTTPNIPLDKLQKALRESQAPKNETGLGLIEGVVFGWYSCLVFGARGIYYCNPKNVLGGQPGPGAVLYSDFPACEFKADGWHQRVMLRAGQFLDCRNLGMVGAVNLDLIVAMLNTIKKLAMAR